MNAVKVLVADPTDDGPERISRLLSENPRIEVIAKASSGAECIRKAILTRPHVILMDLLFSDLTAAQIIKALGRLGQPVSVYLIGPHVSRDNPLLEEALAAGAFDFIRCRRGSEDLITLQRQIINRIFVAGLSATHRVPRKEGVTGTPGLGGLLKGKRLVAVAFAPDRLAEVSVFLTGFKVGANADVVLVVGATGERARAILTDLSELVDHQLRPITSDVELAGGGLHVTTQRPQDLVVSISGLERRQLLLKGYYQTQTEGPRLDTLFKSIASHFRDSAAAIVFGGDGTDGIYGLKAIQDAGGVTLVDDHSGDFMIALKQWLPTAKIPTGIAPLDDLRLLMREIW